MHADLQTYIDRATELEISTSRLYALFAELCPEDSGFWRQLELEEMNHAALLRAGKELAGYDKFPVTLIPAQLSELDESLRLIEESKEDFRNNPVRSRAFSIAFELENSAGELHYQNFMSSDNEDSLGKLFRTLNRADSNHALRIKSYYESLGEGEE